MDSCCIRLYRNIVRIKLEIIVLSLILRNIKLISIDTMNFPKSKRKNLGTINTGLFITYYLIVHETLFNEL